ncbi:MAG: metal-sulfur cluster assembly factor [Burkholderiales bacterium]|nr:metal-sulfur cluster assembly factor [Burkholderiales bacterium]MDE2456287.1 metal-sulfur cluster assembly factor [Burkholderiales bacterium]
MSNEAPEAYAYSGPEELRAAVFGALSQVVDPEVAMNIVDVGLVYGVSVADEVLRVVMTMTSAACPVADVIVEDVEAELERIAPPATRVEVEIVWEPPWSTERMSPRAKQFMGW